MIKIMLKGLVFLIEVVVDYDPHHVIPNRRHANKNKPFEHFEVAGLSKEASWMDYPKDIKNGGNMQEDSLSSAPRNNSHQHDISSIVAVATHVTPLASFFWKKKKKERETSQMPWILNKRILPKHLKIKRLKKHDNLYRSQRIKEKRSR